jgi:hypothetical protein
VRENEVGETTAYGRRTEEGYWELVLIQREAMRLTSQERALAVIEMEYAGQGERLRARLDYEDVWEKRAVELLEMEPAEAPGLAAELAVARWYYLQRASKERWGLKEAVTRAGGYIVQASQVASRKALDVPE